MASNKQKVEEILKRLTEDNNEKEDFCGIDTLTIAEELDLRRPIYKQTAAYGHFGRTDLNLPWEQLNKVEEIKKLL